MRRRDFVTLLGSAAVAWPFAGHTQQLNNYRIGYLGVGSAASQDTRFSAFRAGLAALGYVEGKNIVVEQRWLGNRPYDQLDNLARQLVDLQVNVIVTHATPGVLAAKRATTTIPIVIAAVGDAVETGLVSSLARPGGNVTGTTFFNPELSAKRTELLKEAIPGLVKAGILYNPSNPSNPPVLAAVNTTAQSLKLELVEFPVREPTDLNGTFAAMAAKSVGAFVITEDPMLIYNVSTSSTFALQHLLAGCGFPEFARAGGFVGYGVYFPELWRHAATDPERHKACQHPGRATNEISNHREFEDRENHRRRSGDIVVAACRRGHRIVIVSTAAQNVRSWHKADIRVVLSNVRFWE